MLPSINKHNILNENKVSTINSNRRPPNKIKNKCNYNQTNKIRPLSVGQQLNKYDDLDKNFSIINLSDLMNYNINKFQL